MQAQRYVPKKISDLKKTDSRISLVGKVVSSSQNSFVLQDGSGEAEIFSDAQVQEGSLARIFCNSIDGRLKAEVVQSLNGLDLNLFQKAQELYRKVGI